MILSVLLQKRKILGLNELPASWSLIVVGLIVLIATFFRKQFFTPQVLAGIAMLIMLATFAVNGYVLTYSMYVVVGILLLCSSILAFKRKKSGAD